MSIRDWISPGGMSAGSLRNAARLGARTAETVQPCVKTLMTVPKLREGAVGIAVRTGISANPHHLYSMHPI